MDLKDKEELLLKDLSARLTYGVKIWYKYYPDKVTERFATSIRLVDEKIALSSKFSKEGDWYPIEEANELLIKPYLRPMASMTEEEEMELTKITSQFTFDRRYNLLYVGRADDGGCNLSEMEKIIDYLLSHHFDFRGLIPLGLALEAQKGMY